MDALRWDVFCRVVDNYGDAGVCWRLARALAAEHALDVTLRIDRLATLVRFEPAIDARRAVQSVAGVRVCTLDEAAAVAALPDVVIEAFGCGLPPAYVAAMAASSAPPLWINLEYLSAEPWVDSVHAMASARPRDDLTRYFWFPGFTLHTGGLIRESGLIETRDAFQAHEARRGPAEPLRIVLFCYPNRALPALFEAWAESDEPVACAVPEGVATAALDQWLHGDVPHAGQVAARGRLALDVFPFTAQDGFDRLLWRSDLNFVRGEDSFVRAQWAARPFVWQPYPQEENAHLLKLDAFLARYTGGLDERCRNALTRFWHSFNAEDGVGTMAAWPDFRVALDALAAHGRRWAAELAALPELTAGLVDFARSRL